MPSKKHLIIFFKRHYKLKSVYPNCLKKNVSRMALIAQIFLIGEMVVPKQPNVMGTSEIAKMRCSICSLHVVQNVMLLLLLGGTEYWFDPVYWLLHYYFLLKDRILYIIKTVCVLYLLCNFTTRYLSMIVINCTHNTRSNFSIEIIQVKNVELNCDIWEPFLKQLSKEHGNCKYCCFVSSVKQSWPSL